MNQKLLQMQSVNKEWLKHKKDIEEIIEAKNYHLKQLVEKVFEAVDYNKSGTLSKNELNMGLAIIAYDLNI